MYGVFAPNFHSKFVKFHPKITFSSFFHETLLESLRDSHSPGQEFHFFDSKITHFHFFHTCTAFWLQKFITKSQNGVQRSHFGLQSGHRRAWPARPAGRAGWPSLAGPGWPARPPGPACRPVGCSAGGGGEEGRAKEGGSAPAEPRPPTPITAGWLFCIWLMQSPYTTNGKQVFQ